MSVIWIFCVNFLAKFVAIISRYWIYLEWDKICTKLSSKKISQFDNNMAYFVDIPIRLVSPVAPLTLWSLKLACRVSHAIFGLLFWCGRAAATGN